MNNGKKVAISGLLLYMLCGCFGNTPLKTLNYSSATETHNNLIVFLRGIGGNNQDFVRTGFVSGVRQRELPFAMTAPNAHFGYYFSQTLTERLNTDIIVPARINGYEKIWLVGLSMGGLGSLMYAKDHPNEIAGIYLIAPFLGYEDIIDEISTAGGVRQWQPGEYDADADWQRTFWHWLQQCAAGERPMPNIYLGFGTQDDFNPAHKLLSTLLPADHIFAIDGDHDNKTMLKLWQIFLQQDILVNSANAPTPRAQKPSTNT
ncbi:MAG: alpha/beta hydrolase [Desulfuromonas sp.]|nr:alpha/beta hydrolase [Desulfuromonas sp.]